MERDPFAHVPACPPDSIFGVLAGFRADTNPNKVNLSVGAYRDDDGNPYVLKVVQEVERRFLSTKELAHNKEYLPISGDVGFRSVAANVLFGSQSPVITQCRNATVQSLSGTGALRLGFDFIHKFLPGATVYISSPTWGNHKALLNAAGVPFQTYPYFHPDTKGLDFQGMVDALEKAPSGSVILFHTCAHNPTGVDPSKDQWHHLSDLCRRRQLIPFFDTAYQGFATGNLENDAYALRHFAERGFTMFAAQSFAKNFGLYGERTGAFHVVHGGGSSLSDAKERQAALLSQICRLARTSYSNPPKHGALIVRAALEDPQLAAMWQEDIIRMSERIMTMRKALYEGLKKRGTPGSWEHILQQIGMFTFTGLSPAQCASLVKDHHIYLLGNGRISMAGLNTKNVDYVAASIDQVVRTK